LCLAVIATGCFAQIPRSDRPALSDTATPFTLRSQRGAPFALGDALAQGHAVIVFYRGHW
jgi:peroxiredoxin